MEGVHPFSRLILDLAKTSEYPSCSTTVRLKNADGMTDGVEPDQTSR